MSTELHLPDGVPVLAALYMYITGGCNLACRHCWIAPTFEKDGGTGQCLDYGLFESAVVEAIPLGLSRIKFTGGEPLLHPDFLRMVDYAAWKQIKIDIETNGTLVTRSMARHLKEESSLYHISVSIDGASPETHDYMRGVPGSFERAWRGIGYLVDAGFKPQVIMSLFPDNVAEMEPLIHLAIKSGCSSVKFNLIQPSGRGAQMKKNDGLLSIEELVNLGYRVEKEMQKRFPIPLLFSWPMAFHGIRRLHVGMGENCNVFHILGVLAGGDLALCGIGTQEKELIYGRLGTDSVADVWTSAPGVLRLRDLLPGQLEGICSRCLFKNRCLGACAAQNYHASGRLTAPFWFCSQADEAGLFPRTKIRHNEVASRDSFMV